MTHKKVKRSRPLFPRGRPKKNSPAQKLEALRRASDLGVIRKGGQGPIEVGELRWVRTWIDRELLAAEPALAQMAWVENRSLSPLARTELFAKDYEAKFRRVIAKKTGKSAAKARPIAKEFALNSRAEINSLWRARAEADALGVPYDMYLDAVIDGHIENDKWRRPPRPNQLYGKLDAPRLRGRPTADDISIRLACLATDPQFGVDAYRADPVQEVVLSLIQSDVLAAKNPITRLAVYLIDWRMITEDRARLLFGSELTEAAIDQRGQPVSPIAQPLAAFRPACMGGYQQVDDEPCKNCPVRDDCRSLGEEVQAELVRVTGTDDPRLAHRRQVDRERQRRHRAKARKLGKDSRH